ncbi:hypothetical protein [Planomonospora venezuelensis]|uniref:Uncharacterized protein n=1 Tax=Planomonospora venezuelensis TaxID=1999 RepID=A0A841D7C3_PLAVE|nr:hypothetical protein [Planomonospora venezuelensis]MBB5964055.1 hypothetical protein [Planomonospora venezuelensis]
MTPRGTGRPGHRGSGGTSSLPLRILEEMDGGLLRKLLDARIPRSWTLQPCSGFDPPPDLDERKARVRRR